MVPQTAGWQKLELKIFPHLAQSIESEIMDRFLYSRCLGNHIELTDMIGSFGSSANASMVAKNGIKDISTSKLFCPSLKI